MLRPLAHGGTLRVHQRLVSPHLIGEKEIGQVAESNYWTADMVQPWPAGHVGRMPNRIPDRGAI